jgi:hypothetical protein
MRSHRLEGALIFELQKLAELLLNKVFDNLLDILQSDGASGGLVLFVRARPCREEWLLLSGSSIAPKCPLAKDGQH